MEIRKNIQSQDSGFKLRPVRSGESAINLSKDILDLIYCGSNERELNTNVTFTIYKEDYLQAFCFLISKLPLYKTTSQSATRINFSLDFYAKYLEEIENYFGKELQKKYSCNLLLRKDGRNYLNNLHTNGFSIRDFLIEDSTELIFGKNKTGDLYLRLNCLKENQSFSELILSDSQHCHFALKCFSYFKETDIWGNIDNYVNNFKEGDSVKVSGQNFSLTGLFKYVDEDQLTTLNTPRRRWFLEPFTLTGKTVYLSTEWYPEIENGRLRLNICSLENFIKECFGPFYFIQKNADDWELRKYLTSRPGENNKSISSPSEDIANDSITVSPFSINSLLDRIKETGLLYSPTLIKRFAFSLMSKRFLILSGLAGSGKTQLALAFASALIEDDSQMQIVPVGADWTNREPLLGFPNALKEGSYVMPESGALNLLIQANKPENSDKPYFLILDEMNMSYVERYFADFLSSMESHKSITLWNESDGVVPKEVSLPKNLYIIGTINVDETTYMFSPKVLDRANVIEFKISEKEMGDFLTEMRPVDRDSIKFKASKMGRSFVSLTANDDVSGDPAIKETLQSFFIHLKSVNAEFGYRSATEIYRFISQATNNDDTDDKLTLDQILDCAMVQKLLPKLHGSRKKLEPVLQALWKECFENPEDKETMSISQQNVEKAKYPLTADKIQRMYEAAYANGFTSFAEA